MKRERRNWSAEEKTSLLRRHLIEKIPISKICEEAKLAPSPFHRWQEQRIRRKDEVLAELSVGKYYERAISEWIFVVFAVGAFLMFLCLIKY